MSAWPICRLPVTFGGGIITAPSFDITISLASGLGVGGPVLFSSAFTLADGFNGLHIEDFSALGTISPGDYTVVFTSGATGRGALRVTQTDFGDPLSDPYNEDGLLTIFGNLVLDFRVSVTGDVAASTTPEPTSFTLLGLGLASLGFMRRTAGANGETQ